jgi:hypothetical protein
MYGITEQAELVERRYLVFLIFDSVTAGFELPADTAVEFEDMRVLGSFHSQRKQDFSHEPDMIEKVMRDGILTR